MIDSFVEECHGNPSFVSWLRRHTPFFSVKEFIWLLFVIYNYLLYEPFTPGTSVWWSCLKNLTSGSDKVYIKAHQNTAVNNAVTIKEKLPILLDLWRLKML